MLGPTFDYTHRLIDFSLARTATRRRRRRRRPPTLEAAMPRVTDIIAGDDLIERNAKP